MKNFITIAVFLLVSFSANATIITGDLSYDDTGTHLITGPGGVTYLGWGEAAGLTYAETVTETAAGGIYEGYHIASHEEGLTFYESATGVTTSVSDNYIDASFDHSQFGDNWDSSISVVWYLGDISADAGSMMAWDGSLSLIPDNKSFSHPDSFAASGLGSWLLVSDPVAVPEPGSLALFGLGLMGLGLARKKYC